MCGWSGRPPHSVEPRIALQLVNEAALCVTGIRQTRSLSQKGFEIANGLPFVVSDPAAHDLLDAHTMAESEALQTALGCIRAAGGHFQGDLLAVDPHRMRSYSVRQMRRRKGAREAPPVKTSQLFFCLDAHTAQPIAFTMASPSRAAPDATPNLLRLVGEILPKGPQKPLVLLDTEHIASRLFGDIVRNNRFDLIAPQPRCEKPYRKFAELDPDVFTQQWPGYATVTRPYRFVHDTTDLHQLVQRSGQRPEDWRFKAFVATRPDDALHQLTRDYPRRWHIEEFFNTNQALGWQRAGTLNLNIRYGHATMALLAQAALHQLRQRLPEPIQTWDARHFANALLAGLDGDLRVHDDTLIVTYYNAPHTELLKPLYQGLPHILERENVDPRIPWLWDFKLDFRFK